MAPQAKQFTLGTAILWLAGNDKKLKSFLRGAERDIKASWKGLKTAAAEIDSQIMAVHDKVVGGLETGAAVAAGLTALVAGAGLGLFKLGMDAVETRNLFDVSMGSMGESSRAWAKQFASDLGLNESNIERYLGVLTSMQRSMGLTDQEAAKNSQSLVKLAYDMASFYNLPVDEAMEKIRSGLSGESEPLKQLGILIQDTQLKARAAVLGIGDAFANGDATAKVRAFVAEIMAQTSLVQGDLQRTANSNANIVRGMWETLQNIGTAIGSAMQEPGNVFLVWVRDRLRDVGKWVDDNGPRLERFFNKLKWFGADVGEAIGTMAASLGIELDTYALGNAVDWLTNRFQAFDEWWDEEGRARFADWSRVMAEDVRGSLEWVTSTAEGIWSWVISHQELVKTLGVGLLLYPLVAGLISMLASVCTGASAAFSLLSNAVLLVKGGLALLAGMLGTTTAGAAVATFAVTGLTAAVTAFVQMMNSGDWSHNWITDLIDKVDSLKKGIDWAFDGLVRLYNFLTGNVSNAYAQLSQQQMNLLDQYAQPVDSLLPTTYDDATHVSGVSAESTTVNAPIGVTINIHGAGDPAAVGREVEKAVNRAALNLQRGRKWMAVGATF